MLVVKEFVSRTMITKETGKSRVFSYHSNSCKDEKYFIEIINLIDTQPAITCSKLTIETLEQGVKYVQS